MTDILKILLNSTISHKYNGPNIRSVLTPKLNYSVRSHFVYYTSDGLYVEIIW